MLEKKKIKDEFNTKHISKLNDSDLKKYLEKIYPIGTEYYCVQDGTPSIIKDKLTVYLDGNERRVTDHFGGYVLYKGGLALKV